MIDVGETVKQHQIGATIADARQEGPERPA